MSHFYRFHRVLERKRHFWRRIRNQRENLPRKTFFIRHFNVVLGWNSFKMSKSLKSGFLKKWPISTVFTVLQPEISKSDTGFGFSVKFQLKKVLFFLNSIGYFVGAATFRNSNFQKSGGLAFLTSLCVKPQRRKKPKYSHIKSQNKCKKRSPLNWNGPRHSEQKQTVTEPKSPRLHLIWTESNLNTPNFINRNWTLQRNRLHQTELSQRRIWLQPVRDSLFE